MKRDEMIERITTEIEGAYLTGHPSARLPGHASFVFDGIDGNTLVTALERKKVLASCGSACHADVLRAVGVPESRIAGALRLSIPFDTTEEQIEIIVNAVKDSVCALRTENK